MCLIRQLFAHAAACTCAGTRGPCAGCARSQVQLMQCGSVLFKFLYPHPLSERVCRVEAESKTVRQVGADLLRLQERLEAEKGAREGELGALRAEVHDVLANRNVTDEKFQVSCWGGWGATAMWGALTAEVHGVLANGNVTDEKFQVGSCVRAASCILTC